MADLADLAVIEHGSLQTRCIESALTGLSESSRRVYRSRISAFLTAANTLTRESVKQWMRHLELTGSSAQVRNQSLAAIKRLASEAAELGWIEHAAALQIGRIKSRRVSAIRSGKWLDAQQCRKLLDSPDRSTVIGRRDACVLALLLGCGLRRAEACSLGTRQIRVMNDRLVITVTGKGDKTRAVSVPKWAQTDIERWMKETEL